MAGSQISTSVTILNSLHGFQALSLTEYSTSAAASIAAGSVVEIAGAFFTFAGDEAINASSWTSIVTGTTAYITLTPSGTAGSQIVDAAYTSTAPTWRDDFQGWYASAASSVRVIGSVFKAEATSYYPKYIYNSESPESYRQTGKQIFTTSGVFHVPLTVNQVYLTGCAAGGNGGSGSSGSVASGGGGGGGEIVYKKLISVTPGQSIIVTIGAAGVNTSFGAVSFNYGGNGGNAGIGVYGTAGVGGALVNGTVSGADGGTGAGVGGNSAGFAFGGNSGGTYTGAGGAGGLGNFATYSLPSSGASSASSGNVFGSLGGGGGGGGYGGAGTGGAGGRGGIGGGGGGGGGGATGGAGGSGGSAILIVEW